LIDEVVIPRIPVEIFSCEVGSVRWIPAEFVLNNMLERIGRAAGTLRTKRKANNFDFFRFFLGTGFRQEAICKRWRELFSELPIDFKFPVISVRCKVSSGTYIRSLAQDIGQKVKVKWLFLTRNCSNWGLYQIGGLAYSIFRSSVGEVRELGLKKKFPFFDLPRFLLGGIECCT
jgi:hypothetical protein